MKRTLQLIGLLGQAGMMGMLTLAQGPPGSPRGRTHSVTSKGVLRPLPATVEPSMPSRVSIEVQGDERVIHANGIPNHKTGSFPNRGNPNRISSQRHEYRIPANPRPAERTTPLQGEFGVAINGVPFDPGAAEFYAGESGWQYEPLSGAIQLGIDVSHAHVQPTGKYHYHGLPTGLLDDVELTSSSHSPLIGWAADGFPIYAMHGYSDADDADSMIQTFVSSYQLKQGKRPGGNAPGGVYDGTFVQDYEYVVGSGDLDECNGRFCVTPDFPDGTYAYFMTENWPVVPRVFRGTPSRDFRHGPPRGGGRPSDGERGRGAGPRDPYAGSGFARDQFARDQFDRDRFDHGPPQGRSPRSGGGSPDHWGPPRRGEPRSRDSFGSRRQPERDPYHSGPPHDQRPPRPGELLPPSAAERLGLTEQQQQDLAELQRLVDQRLDQILTQDQLRALQVPPPPPRSSDR
ncbi:MAG: YHYH protein [Planctomycetota bacterium]